VALPPCKNRTLLAPELRCSSSARLGKMETGNLQGEIHQPLAIPEEMAQFDFPLIVRRSSEGSFIINMEESSFSFPGAARVDEPSQVNSSLGLNLDTATTYCVLMQISTTLAISTHQA